MSCNHELRYKFEIMLDYSTYSLIALCSLDSLLTLVTLLARY